MALSLPLLAGLFALTALLYSAAGFGGGSTYTALLVLSGRGPAEVPVISLTCNILVVAVGAWRFARAGHVDLRRIWPLFAASIPAAFVGGALPVSRVVFIGLLAASLFVAGLAMLYRPRDAEKPPRTCPRLLEPLLGGALGLLAGIVGIGGGIYLAPVLHLLRWGSSHAIAGTCAVFILVNSIAGLGGQLAKSGAEATDILADHWLLLPAVVAGGFLGSLLTVRKVGKTGLRVLTALLILFVAVQLTRRFFELV
jgi:uncharacterized membrane protein YfcA